MTGKEKCKRLKAIRKSVADRMGIDLHQTECTWEGECKGTCPKCRQEEEILNAAIMRKGATLAGAAVLATSLAACTPNGILLGQRNGGGSGNGGDDGIEQLSGDVAPIDDEDDLDGGYGTDGRSGGRGDDGIEELSGETAPIDDDGLDNDDCDDKESDGKDDSKGTHGDDDTFELSGMVAEPDDEDL